jgi:hypothetical protein
MIEHTSNAIGSNEMSKLEQLFRKCGAKYVEILGDMVCTSWATKALADKAEATMRRAGISDIDRGMNGPRTEYVTTGWIG